MPPTMDWKARIPALVLWLALLFSSIEDGNAEQRVVCYYTNWSVYRPGTAKFSPQNINPYLCTHLIYAFGGFTKDNTLKPFDKYQDIEKGGYAKFTGLKTYNKNLKTMLAIGGWNEGSSRFSPMVADPGRRKEFVKNSVKFLRQNHFDGLDLDWEYPAFRDGGKPRDRNNYADLVQELREEFERESSKTGRSRLLLSMAVPAGIEYIDKGYDIPRLNDYLDFINLLSYDYHSAFEPAVNHHSPLYPLEEDNEYNYDAELTIDYTIDHLLKSGASSEKIVLGIPTYGRSYTLINEDATDIGAPADGPGEEGDATREKGYLAYYEICENIAKSEEWEVVQPNPSAMGPYAFRQNQWVGYDDEDIVRAKARYVIEKKLGGIMFWSIDNDDFRGKCHGRPYPLIEAAKEALLAGSERSNSGQKTKLSDNRKKTRTQGGQRIQSNSLSRKVGAGNRRTTTQAPTLRRKIGSSRSNARSNARSNVRSSISDDDDDEEDDQQAANVVRAVDKPRTRIRSKGQSKNRLANAGRRKQQQNSRQSDEADSTNQASLRNSFTTPEPPTTPDPGSDFKCEDEGFFSHPRDCKKYFWCLDSGPGGLGIVGHQFTCPSGLVFNKAADSCDYPRNVVCPKKNSQSTVTTTTKAPMTTRTALHKSAKRTTTPKPIVEEEEYEYYDDEEEDSEEAEPSTTTTTKPLQYKTINRSRPTTTTSASSTTTTEATIAASTRSYKTTPDRLAGFEDEEDPRVLKELIDLIKKAGGIEQLEKQLHYQEKNSGGNGDKTESNGKSTPATISRSLYERVLSRQATRIAGSFLGSLSTTQSTNGDKTEQRPTKNSRTGFVNGPGGAQFEGLDNIPEVKSLRRTNKPKYVTIERHRPSTSESPAEKDEEVKEEEDDDDDEEEEDDNTDVASSEDRAVSNPPQHRNTNRRVTPSYVNIRRPRPSTTTSENDVEVKDDDTNQDPDNEEDEGKPVTQRHRIVKAEEESTGPKSRYTNINRFRSTTSRNNEVDQTDEISEKNEITTESTTTTTATPTTTKVIPVTDESEEIPIPSTTTLEPLTTSEPFSTSTLEQSSISVGTTTESSTVSLNTDTPLKLVEESATEILFTTVPASSSSPGSSTEPFTRGPSIAAVSQPRPFGFPRRGRPTASTPSTSSVASVTEQSRPKVDSETLRLPTLKELVGYSTVVTESIADLTSTFAPSTKTFVNITIDTKALQNVQVDRTVSKSQRQNLILSEDKSAEATDTLEVVSSRVKGIFDNDVLESEEVQERSYSSSFAAAAAAATDESFHTRSTEKRGGINNTNQSIKRIEVPVKILDDTDGEEIGELILLRIPESKLNSAILKPVFRVKVLEPDQEGLHKDIKRNGILSGSISVESSSENELSDNQRRPSRRRRVKINSTPTDESGRSVGERTRPRNRQRIVKARRRTRVNEIPLDRSEELNLNTQEDEQSVRVEENGRITRRRDSVDGKLEKVTSTSAYPTETSTTIRVTTIRGNLPTSSKPSNGTRGFYITRSSYETATLIPDAVTTDITIDSTNESLMTSSDVIDESTRKTDFATESHETLMPQMERIYPTTEDSMSYESIATDAFGNIQVTTSIANEINSLGNLLKSTSDKYETVSPDYLSTIEDGLTDSIAAMITTTENEAIEQPSITTFGLFTTRDPASNPTIPISTTPEYSSDSTTLAIDKYSVTNIDEFTTNIAETSKTSANSHYKTLSTSEIKNSSIPITTESDENNMSITTQTERSLRRTTYPIDKETTYGDFSNRGRIRFTASSRDNPRRTTKFSESDDSRIDVVSHTEVSGRNSTSTEISDKKVEPTSRIIEHTSRSSTRNRSRQRSTTKSAGTDDYAINSAIPKQLTSEYTSATEANRLSTNFVESTGKFYTSRSSSRKFEHRRKTTKALEADDDRINSVTPVESTSRIASSTEVYDKNVESPIDTTETNDLSTSFVETTETEYTFGPSSNDSDQPKKTTKFFEENDIRINSVTPVEFSSLNNIATEVYDKTVESTIASTETINPNTSFVEITESSYTSRLPAVNNDQSPKMISLEIDDTTITSIISPDDPTTEKNVTYATVTNELEETTESNLLASKGANDPQITTKSLNTDHSIIASTTPKETIILSSAITTEPYDTTVLHSSITTENYRSPDIVETTASRSYTTSLLEDASTTTEIYDKTADLLEMSRIDFLTTEENVSQKALTNGGETIDVTLAATTTPWIYNRQKNVTKILEDDKAEIANIPSDVTLASGDVNVTETFPSTTEVDMTDRTFITLETGAANTQITEQQKISTVSVLEATTALQAKIYDSTDATEQSYATTTSAGMIIDQLEESTPANSPIEKIDTSTISSTSTTLFSKSNDFFNVTRTTSRNYDGSTKDSYTSVTPNTSRDTKRTRGRVRFTNFAANTDDIGRNRRPVKQVVVRRRPAKASINQQQINDSTEEKKTISNLYKIKEKGTTKKVADEELAEEKRNSTKSMRRRVVVYRGRPRAESITTPTTTTTSTTTMQSSNVTSDEVSEDIGRSRRRKWRKRVVLKRAKTNDLDDQSIAETGHVHRAMIDDSIEEDFRPLGSHITKPVGHVNSTEHKDEDIINGEVNIYKNSGGFLRRPGTLIRPDGANRSRTSSVGSLLTVTQVTGQPAPFSKIRPVEDTKTEDQSGRAQELAVTLADPPEIRATATTGRLPFRKTTRKISTTIAPRTEALTTSRTTPISRGRQRGNSNNDKIIEIIPTRPRRPAIIDYDYYVDDEVRLVLKPELKDKLYVTRKGGIRCLDQGNFAHPTSCKKFITCARMVNGQVLGTEYTCPDKLSFDPVGGICNWSAGLGCEDKNTP